MANDTRPSLTKTIEERYATQRCGGAFDVKKVLGNPGYSPQTGTIIDAVSIPGNKFQSPVGFEVKVPQGQTQLKDAQSSPSKEISIYLSGFNNVRYQR